jgi:RNA polymerase sigma factor (sigma-70 family)
VLIVSPATDRGHDEDVALMTAYRGGDDRAFVDLIGRYESRLRGMCWHYLRDHDMVDDVLQETFCRVIEGAYRIDQGFNVAAWIHRIAANLCIDELRRRTQRTRSHVVYADADSVVNDIADTDQRGRPEKALELDATASPMMVVRFRRSVRLAVCAECRPAVAIMRRGSPATRLPAIGGARSVGLPREAIGRLRSSAPRWVAMSAPERAP